MDLIALIYLGVILIFVLAYLSLKKPIIFPFGAYVFLLPFDSILSVAGSPQGGTLTKFLGILTIPVLAIKGAFENRLKPPNTASLWWALFIVFGAISLMWAIQPEMVLTRIPTAFGLLLLYFAISTFQFKPEEIKSIEWCILAGGILAAIFSIYSYSTVDHISELSQRATMAIGDRDTDPNQFAFSLLIPVAICIYMMLKADKVFIKFLLLLGLAIILFAIISTSSRSGFLGAGTILIAYTLFYKRKITIGTISIVILICLILFAPELFFKRWQLAKDTGGAGRLSIWYVGWMAFQKHWLIGAGLSNFPSAFSEFAHAAPVFMGYDRDPHNIYIGLLVELGLVGFFLLSLGIWKHYKIIQSPSIQTDADEKAMLKAALLAILISSMFLNTVWRKSFWLIWMMIMMQGNRLGSMK